MRTKILALIFTFFLTKVYGQSASIKAFNKEAAQLGLQFMMPAGYQLKEVIPNRDLPYNFAIISADSTMEIRYSLFPLKPLLEKYKSTLKSHRVMIHPDSIHKGLMKANGKRMTNGDFPEVRALSADTLQKFKADYGGTCSFQFMCEFGKGYKYGQAVNLHKKGIADVIVTFLSNDLLKLSSITESPYFALAFR